jgi:hypothetical protein
MSHAALAFVSDDRDLPKTYTDREDKQQGRRYQEAKTQATKEKQG